MKTKIFGLAVMLSLSAVLGACGDTTTPSGTTTPAVEPTDTGTPTVTATPTTTP
jgi:ABC-type uncharacterized transport system auxiliary subunit